MATTTVGPVSTQQLNSLFYVGGGAFATIQQAVNFAQMNNGGIGQVVILQGYEGGESIGDIDNGSAELFLSDRRDAAAQDYVWDATEYVPAYFVQENGSIESLTADTITAQDASFDTCEVVGSPVRTFANTPDGGGGASYPPAGIGVSTGTAWVAESIDPETLAYLADDNDFAGANTFEENLFCGGAVTAIGTPPHFPSTQSGVSIGADAGATEARIIMGTSIAPPDQKLYDFWVTGDGILYGRLWKDDFSDANHWLEVVRSGYTSSQVNLIGDVDVSGELTAASGVRATGFPNNSTLSSTTQVAMGAMGGNPEIVWVNAAAPVDQKIWDAYADGTTLHFRMVSDAWSAGFDWMSIVRSGTSATSVNVGAFSCTYFVLPCATNDFTISTDNGSTFIDGGAGGRLLINAHRTGGTCQVTGEFLVNGAKNFVTEYPGDPSRLLYHSCIEGPECAVFYRGEGVTVDGICEITLPEYFEGLVMATNRSVLVSALLEDDAEEFGMVAATRVVDGKFRVCSSLPTQHFSWEVKAVRGDIDELEVVRENITIEQHAAAAKAAA